MFASKAHVKAPADTVTVRAQTPAAAGQQRSIAAPAVTGHGGAADVEVEDDELRIDRLPQHIAFDDAGASLPSPWDLVRVPPSRDAMTSAIGSMRVPSIQRACSTCREDEDVLQRAAMTPSETSDSSSGATVGAGEAILRQPAGVEPDDELERDEYEDREREDRVQTKLTISHPDDPYEREADQIAEHFARDPGSVATYGQGPARDQADVQRACDECNIDAITSEESEEDKAQEESEEPSEVSPKREAGVAPPRVACGLDSGFASARADARPLPRHIRQEMERGFGQDFGSVRIHVGHYSSAMCRAIRAKAFTYRRDIYFNAGQFNPATTGGRKLLAHELTHVVQQTGTRGSVPAMLQRAWFDEPKIGNWAHSRIQAALRARDRKLITEAPIPGATRILKAINLVGFADFYKAEGQAISGISAQEPKASKEGQASQAKYKYVKMRQDWIDRADSESRVVPGPVINRGRWNFRTNFPKNFQVAELKPLFPAEFPGSFIGIGTAGSATIQTGNYREGFKEFVERVYKDNPNQQAHLPSSITGRPLVINEANIPPGINYNLFDQQRENAGAGAILKRDSDQRVWIYPLAQGLYVYFLLPHPYTAAGFPQSVTGQLNQLEPLLRRLRERRTNINNRMMPKRESVDSSMSSTPVGVIQRKEDKWKVDAKNWEDARRAWVSGAGGAPKPKEFLKKQAKGPLRKAKIDKELKLKPTGKIGEQVRTVKSIKFWSGFRGRILGALRFRFGHVFDKVEEWFEKLKAKFRKHHANSDKLVKKNGVFSGWKKVATAAIIKFSVVIFKEMLASAFRSFINCINGIIAAILSKFSWAVDEARQEIMEEVQPVCCQVIEFKNQVEDEYKKHEEVIAAFTEAVETIQEWRQILGAVETAIRVGVQIISCGTPPALGCLWGLVAQLGISTGLNLLARTDYFEEEIAKPAARALMSAIVGDKLHNFLIDLLAKTPLEPFLADAADCQKRHSVAGNTKIGGNLDKLDPNLAANAKARADWEREMGPQILRDLQAVFQKGKGQPVNKQDLQKLVDALKDHKATPEQIKAMFEAARDPKSGKLAIEKAAANLEKGEVPEEKVVERNIDYEKAKKANVHFQRALGWNPMTFYPKPGVRVDSEEFADAVYDMQGALGFKKPDGILGEQTLLAFYDQNKRKPDAAYENATRVVEERRKRKEKAEQERQEKLKPKMREGEIEIGPESRGPSVITAIQVEKPADASKIVGQDWIASSPGWVSVPMGEIEPAKSSYQPGERISVHNLHWVKQQWVVFPDIRAEFKSSVETSSPTFGDNLLEVTYVVRENFYFKLSADDETVYEQRKGTKAMYVRK